MSKIYLILVITACSITLQQTLYGQDNITEHAQKKLKSNVVHGSLGFSPFLYGMDIFVDYEHALLQPERSPFKSIWLRAGGGWWVGIEDYGYIADAGLTALTGRQAYHFELYVGGVLLYDQQRYFHINGEREDDQPFHPRKEFISIEPGGSIGFRYQKPGERLVVRICAGYPNLIHLGFGFAF